MMAARKNRDYYQDYYQKNRKRIARRRRARYRSDPDYRAKALARARRRREQVKRDLRRATAGMLTSRQTAEHVGVATRTLRAWEGKGYCPAPEVVAGRRYYRRSQVRLLKKLHGLLSRLGWKVRTEDGWDKVQALVDQVWEAWEAPA